MNTKDIKAISTNLKAIRKDILGTDIRLVRVTAGIWVAVDTVTGDSIGVARQDKPGKWYLYGGPMVDDHYIPGHQKRQYDGYSERYKRLATIIPQWVRGYC